MLTFSISHQKHIVCISEVKQMCWMCFCLHKTFTEPIFFFFFSILNLASCLLACNFLLSCLWPTVDQVNSCNKNKTGALLIMTDCSRDIGLIYWIYCLPVALKNLECVPPLIRSKSLLFPTTLVCSIHSQNPLTAFCWEQLPEWDLSEDNWVEERPGDPAKAGASSR